ncbi:breast cancer type 2 susceptibility protein homolog [Colias croceus]|uniref:breast cancer type 2 susceptibility protein homolog n=1 Tax=Colias crocea TaxID=72248 RepID=UPI001E281213|nr:breast cancer type 2 susceptibility protein homolog [Colias croceus]
MDKHNNDILNFEQALNKRSGHKFTLLYDKTRILPNTCKIEDVISDVSKQIKAIQKADLVKKVPRQLEKSNLIKQSEFLPLNVLSDKVQKQEIQNKFETQCVTDTQLINLVDNAETLAAQTGITQEFETTFCHKTDKSVAKKLIDTGQSTDKKESVKNEAEFIRDEQNAETLGQSGVTQEFDTTFRCKADVNVNKELVDTGQCIDLIETVKDKEECMQDEPIKEKSNEIHTAHTPHKRSKNIINDYEQEICDIFDNSDTEDNLTIFEPLEDNTKSPILNKVKPIVIRNTPKPLVYNLESFEKFEALALPVIEENADLRIAKKIINSQLVNGELCIQSHKNPTLQYRESSKSPVFEVKVKRRNSDTRSMTKDDQQSIENKSIIEDEILFSSDEENYEPAREIDDLPLTCALETSFYNQTGILDKTMYVGFQTASNKSIQIHTDSFVNAKNVLEDSDVDIKDLVNVFDGTFIEPSKLASSEANINEQNVLEATRLTTIEKSVATDIGKVQFETANGKSIEISDQALRKSELFLEDVQKNLIDYNVELEFEKESKLVVNKIEVRDLKSPKYVRDDTHEIFNKKIENDGIDEPNKINDDIILQEFENSMLNEEQDDPIVLNKQFQTSEKSILQHDFQGFKTASLKPIKITDQALLKTRKIFDNIDNDTDNNFPNILQSSIKSDGIHGVPNCVGFSTASNKEIKISKTALLKSKIIFEDINKDLKTSENIEHNEREVTSMAKESKSDIPNDFYIPVKQLNDNEIRNNKFGGFKTANNNPIKVSSKTLAKYKNIFHDIIDGTENQPHENSHQTKIKPQAKTIDKTDKSECKEKGLKFEKNNNHNTNTKFSFKTANEKIVEVSEESLISSQMLLKKSGMDSSNKIRDFTFKGFQTASNKQINISKETLARSKRIFADIESDVDEEIHIKKIKSETKQRSKENTEMQNFKGFQTASNKNIIVSKQTLEKYKTIFDNIDADMGNDFLKEFNPNHERTTSACRNTKQAVDTSKDAILANSVLLDPIEKSSSNFKGFKTASNRPVSISKEALARTKNIFSDIDINIESNLGIPKVKPEKEVSSVKFQFQTANNKPVHISEEAIIASQKLFHDEKVHTSIPKFQGFQTASKKSIAISKETLDKYKTMFDDIDTELKNDFVQEAKETDKPNTVTNNINKVDITEDALANPVLLNDPIEKSSSNFKGFQTASNRPVKISKEALARTKNILNDIDIDTESNLDTGEVKPEQKVTSIKFQFQTANRKTVDISEEAIIASQKLLNDNIENIPKLQGFQTASNKTVKVSKEALAKSKKIYNDIDLHPDQMPKDNLSIHTSDSKAPKKTNQFGPKSVNVEEKKSINNDCDEINMKDIFNTQVVTNFENTLYTEDFLKERTPVQCKRSGSPIVSCPKSKKRKFQAPASVVRNILSAKIDTCQTKTDKIYAFDDSYKKTKKLSLKDLDNIKNNDIPRIEDYILNFNYENMLDYKFKPERNEVTNDIWSTDKIKEVFSEFVNNKIIPLGWIENHLKLIIWKLISYEIRFPHCFERICTVKNVLEQLKYRYDRELYNVQRPALRKILERDDVASKSMVLGVVGVYVDGVYVSSVTSLTDTIELLLTDGWYCLKASIDKYISKLVYDGKISVGMKLFIHGAELVNCEQGVAPWEDTSSVRLKISGNSTRRARWDARLGYHGNAAMLSHLSTVRPEGGKVSKLHVFVTRVYPMLYIEKFEDGSTVTRSERLENLFQMKYENDRQLILEKIYEDVGKEFCDQESQDSENYMDSGKFESGSQIAKIMKKHRDPAEFRANLTESQLNLLQEYTVKRKDKQIEIMQEKVRERIKNSSLGVARSVVPLLKIRVASVENECRVCKGMLSIWRPNEALQEVITENTWIDVYNVVPTAIRNSEIQLSANRNSIFQKSKVTQSEKITSCTDYLKRQCYQIKDIRNSNLCTENNEVDTVGFIISIEPSNKDFENSKQLYQNIYLADENKNLICINFWGGIKKFGFENILDTGQVIACVNLQKRSGNTMRNIPQYRATEFSYFTKTPKYDCLRKLCMELIKVFSGLDRRKFCLDCVAIKNNNANTNHRLPDVSPYRLNNSDYNIAKNKNFIDSPIARDAILNLSSSDFESTFKQTDTHKMSPSKLLRKKKINEKISKLKYYGEPPPLSPMNIINLSKNVTNAFKSPLTSKNDSLNVASKDISTPLRTDKENSNLDCSPVLSTGRNVVKRIISVNPVKLNFNNDEISEKQENTIDPFAEEFDASPPLSLD